MAKDKHTLSELDEVKSILDDTVDLYTNVGDVRAWANKKWLDLVRKDLKKYIEDAAEKEWLGNIKMLNNETQIAKGLQDAISRKDSADAAREMLSVFSKWAIGWAAWYNVWPFDNHTLAWKIWNIAVWALAGRYLFSTKAKTQFASLINKMSGGAKKELERLVAGDLAVKNLSKNTQKELASVFEKSGITEIGTPKELSETEYQALLNKFSKSDLPALEQKANVRSRDYIMDNVNRYKEAKVEYDNFLDGMANDLDGTALKPSLKIENPDGSLREDGISRILEKAADKPHGIDDVTDIVRWTTAVKNKAWMERAIEWMNQKGIKYDDKFTTPTDLWYKDLSFLYNAKNWIRAEVQINTPGMLVAKEGRNAIKMWVVDEAWYNAIVEKAGVEWGQGHKFYEERRKIKEWVKNWSIDPVEWQKKMDEIAKKSRDYYSKFDNLGLDENL